MVINDFGVEYVGYLKRKRENVRINQLDTEEPNCYNCDYWIKGKHDGTCLHYVRKDCRYGFFDEKNESIFRDEGYADESGIASAT